MTDDTAANRRQPSDGPELPFHKIGDAFPLIEGTEFDDLVADIRTNGVREPITIYEGKILDGRNRYRAARAAGVECLVVQYEGDDPIGFVLSLNLRRRHLDASQRAMVAATLADLRRGDNQHSSIGGTTTVAAAKALHVSPRAVDRARTVRDKGVPELAQAVSDGKISVSRAAEIARLPTSWQRDALDASKPPPQPARPTRDLYADLNKTITTAQALVSTISRALSAAFKERDDPVNAIGLLTQVAKQHRRAASEIEQALGAKPDRGAERASANARAARPPA